MERHLKVGERNVKWPGETSLFLATDSVIMSMVPHYCKIHQTPTRQLQRNACRSPNGISAKLVHI